MAAATGGPPAPAALQPLLSASARRIAQLHTLLSTSAFATALVVGLALHHRRIVKNQWYGWPDEWFPSVSATIGDHFPERNLFQLLIALTSGPRFLLIALSFLLHRGARPKSILPALLVAVNMLRTLACGGWVFVTSSDHGDVHDVAMVAYIVLNLPYMILSTLFTPPSTDAKSLRRWLGSTFFATLVPLVYCYIQHKVHRVAGAYSIYALFEWTLIILDVSFDAISILDFSAPASPSSSPSSLASLALQFAPAPPLPVEHALGEAEENQQGALGKVVRAARKAQMETASLRVWAAEVYLAFTWWTLVVGLGPMIFYSSVWAMGLSGQEALLLVILSPFLLCLSPFLPLFSHPAVGHLGALVGLVARYSEDHEGDGTRRLKVSAAGLGMLTTGMVAGWWKDRGRASEKGSIFILGLVLSVLLKFANHSLNPLWPFMRTHATGDLNWENGGWNGIGLALGVVAYLQAAVSRRSPSLPPPPLQQEKKGFAAKAAATVGFASLAFLLHFLFTDTGTIIAWTFNGYPHHGPSAFPGGAWTLVFLCVGLVVPSYVSQRILTSTGMYTACCAAAASALYTLDGWAGFVAGGILGAYSVALFPTFLTSLLSSVASPGAAFGTAFALYALMELLSTIPVAYAFVPFGWVLRERTDLVLAAVVGGVGIGLIPLSSSAPAAPMARAGRTTRRRLSLSALAILALTLSAIVYRTRGGGRLEVAVQRPYRKEERVASAGIWTVHFGLDGRMWESGRRMAWILREAEVDVIGLLETDAHRIVGGNRDITRYISHALDMPYVDLGPGPHKNTWGAALISKFPILRSTHHLLPSPHGELAPAIFATLDVYGTEVDVVVAHNGQEEDPLDRELQSKELARLMGRQEGRPTVFLGYLVTRPHQERPAPYKFVFEDGKLLDVQPKDLDRWCQYIGYRGLHRTAYARLQRGANPSVTDSELQLAKFVVPLPSATGSSYSLANAAALSANASARLSPIPLEKYAQHLHFTPAPYPVEVEGDWAPGEGAKALGRGDPTTWTPERYMPPALRFPERFDDPQTANGFHYIGLIGEKGLGGQNTFMDADEKEALRLAEMDLLTQQAGAGCPVQ
ncbi:hypothetical protein JCM10213_008215 [Rhodosporidiobolus nylandii]